jgi:hypothetical protein
MNLDDLANHENSLRDQRKKDAATKARQRSEDEAAGRIQLQTDRANLIVLAGAFWRLVDKLGHIIGVRMRGLPWKLRGSRGVDTDSTGATLRTEFQLPEGGSTWGHGKIWLWLWGGSLCFSAEIPNTNLKWTAWLKLGGTAGEGARLSASEQVRTERWLEEQFAEFGKVVGYRGR